MEYESQINLRLSEKDKEMLVYRARCLGLTPSEFLRNCIYDENMVIFQIQCQDFNEFSYALNEFNKNIIGLRKRFGDLSWEINVDDISEILDLVRATNELCVNAFRTESDNRRSILKKLYRAEQKKLKKQIEEMEAKR